MWVVLVFLNVFVCCCCCFCYGFVVFLLGFFFFFLSYVCAYLLLNVQLGGLTGGGGGEGGGGFIFQFLLSKSLHCLSLLFCFVKCYFYRDELLIINKYLFMFFLFFFCPFQNIKQTSKPRMPPLLRLFFC